tara:strand:- start:69879 stop:70553 length:675 start_codon:yes stop_codon:yes gene_type:complete
MKEKLVNYVKNKNKLLSNQRHGQLNIFFKDRFQDQINDELVFKKVNSLLPDEILELVDVIYVGNFEDLNKKQMNAKYSDGAIYVTNEQDDEEDLIDDIIHEFAHAVEDRYGDYLYGDGSIEESFLFKRNKLKNILKYLEYNVEDYNFDVVDFDDELDKLFFWHIGYEKLNNLSRGIFLGSYSATSLREFFARGFEEYFLGDRLYLKEVCPYIFNKLSILLDTFE